jgi:hypothetical protein
VGRWLQDYSGALAAGASIVLVIVTIVYVGITSKLSKGANEQLREIRKTRLDAQMPVVAISVKAVMVPGVPSIQIDAEILNIGIYPADVHVLFPLEWKCSHMGAVDSESGGVYFTVNPGGRGTCGLTAEIELSEAKTAGTMRRQIFEVEFSVSPLATGAEDLFTWTTFYDHDQGALIDSRRSVLHEHRTYGDSDSMEITLQRPQRSWLR